MGTAELAKAIEAAIDSGDDERTIALLAPLDETERRAVAPAVVAAHTRVHRGLRLAFDVMAAVFASHNASLLALFGTGTLAQVRACTWYVADDPLGDVLLARRPAWLQEWCDSVAARRWPLVRRLVRAGACERRQSEEYALGLIATHSFNGDQRAVLEASPERLDLEVWDLFRYEGTSELSLSATDKYGSEERSWSAVLCDFAAQGRLSRSRLLDESLDALERDFAQFRAGWFSRFHEALAPTLAERAQRADRYVRLLASPIPPTVSFALKALEVVERAGHPLPASTLEGLGFAFRAQAKGTVLSALRLARRLMAADSSLAARAACFVAALEHPAREVQAAALDALDAHADRNDPVLQTALRMVAASVSASLRARFASLVGLAHPPAPPVPPAPLEAGESERASVEPRVSLEAIPGHAAAEAAVVHAIGDVDELVEAYAAVLEGEASPAELERVLDGVSRLAAARPRDFDRLTGPLKKRAARIAAAPAEEPYRLVRRLFAGLASAWLGGPYLRPPLPAYAWLPAFLCARVDEVAARVRDGRAAPLLAAPSRITGVIDPHVLLERIRAANGSLERFDLIAALLRLDASGRASGGRIAGLPQGEAGDALAYALGDDARRIGPDAALWIAASRARHPRADDPKVDAVHPDHGPDATRTARAELRWGTREWTAVNAGSSTTHRSHFPEIEVTPALPHTARADLPTVNMYRLETYTWQNDAHVDTVRWTGTIWPLNREGWFTRGAILIGTNRNLDSARWENRAYLEPLLDATVPMGPAAIRLVAAGLLTKSAAEGLLAVDILVAAAGDGRLTPAVANALVEQLTAWPAQTLPKRAAPRLAALAKASARGRRLIADALAVEFARDTGRHRSALRPLRELHAELRAELELAPSPAIELSTVTADSRG